MNYSMIFYIIGWILDVEAALLVPSLAVSLIYHESCALAFFITIVLCLIPGVILVRKQPKNKVFYAREGSVTVALSWIVMSIMGSIPFLLSGSITNPVDALFETVSGFTTTGASILPAVEPSWPRASWNSAKTWATSKAWMNCWKSRALRPKCSKSSSRP